MSAHLSREGRRLLAMLENPPFFRREWTLGSQIFRKTKKNIPPKVPHPCRCLATDTSVQTHTKCTQQLPDNSPPCRSNKRRFCSVGISLPWHQKAAAQSPLDSFAALPNETPLGPSAAAFSLGAILIPPPQGHRLLPRHPQPDYRNRQVILKSVKQNPLYIHHPTSIPEPCSTITRILPCTERDGQRDPPWVSHAKGQLNQTCSSSLKTLFHPKVASPL